MIKENNRVKYIGPTQLYANRIGFVADTNHLNTPGLCLVNFPGQAVLVCQEENLQVLTDQPDLKINNTVKYVNGAAFLLGKVAKVVEIDGKRIGLEFADNSVHSPFWVYSTSLELVTPIQPECTCDRRTLLIKGCQCGAIKPYHSTR